MKFEDTGLKKDPVVEEAFNYAYAYNQSLAPEVQEQLKQQLDVMYQDNLDYLNAAKEAGKLDEDQYNATKSKLDESMENQLKRLPQIAERQLDLMFNKAKLAPVLELQQ